MAECACVGSLFTEVLRSGMLTLQGNILRPRIYIASWALDRKRAGGSVNNSEMTAFSGTRTTSVEPTDLENAAVAASAPALEDVAAAASA